MLEIRLLGQFQIRIDGKTVDISSRAEQSLLAYLVLNAGSAYRREHLAGLFWPGSDERKVKGYLRLALWRLRKTIHETVPTAPDYFQANKISIAFDAGLPYWLDSAVLENGTESGLEALHSATQVYTGELLPGFYDEWVVLERERLRAVFNRKMQRLLEQLQIARQWRDLIRQAERWISMGDHPEPAYRALILGYAELGDMPSALAAFERCVTTLEHDLGIEPSEETQTLLKKIQADQLKQPVASSIRQPQIKPQLPAFLDIEKADEDRQREGFVGREVQLARMAAYLETACTGQSQVAFVSAEAGMGKSSLLANFSRRAQEKYPKLIVASGICTTYTETGDPYLPFREILRMLTADVEGKWTAGSLTRDHALRLWHFLPSTLEALLNHGRSLLGTFLSVQELLSRSAAHRSIKAELTSQLREFINRNREVNVTQERIFEEYTAVLRRISTKSPLLLILDDLHWADTSSLNLLFHLGRRLSGSPILILGAYRPEEVDLGRQGDNHPLAGVLDEFKRLYGDIWLTLDHSSAEEGRRFVDALLDREPNLLSEAFREQLSRNTRGQPLFTIEMLREMQAYGDLIRNKAGQWTESQNIHWDNLPGRVEGVIAKRINRLDHQQKEALLTASVEGEDFTAEVIAKVRKIDEGTVVKILSGDLEKVHKLVQARGVEQIGDQHVSSYQFGHNLFQKYLYNTLDPVERVYQHSAVGSALERLYQDRTEAIAVQLARHFQEARANQKAIQYLKQAGDAAAHVYANTEAIVHYRRAIDLAEHTTVSDEDISNLYTRLGRVLELQASFDQALSTYERLGEIAVQRANRAIELASLMARITILTIPTTVHEPKQARALGERALNLAGELGDPAAEAKILWNLSIANFFSGRLSDAINCGERSLALARKNNLVEQTAQTLNDLGGFIYLYSAKIDQAKQALSESSKLWRELGNIPMLADSLSSACSANVYAGDFDKAVSFSEEAFQISHSINNLWGQSYSKWMIGEAFREQGEYSRAVDVMEECIRLGKQAGFMASQDYIRMRLGSLYMELGALDQAVQSLKVALPLSRSHNTQDTLQGLGVLARLQVLNGELEKAELSISEGKQDPHREAWATFYLPVLFAEVELAKRRGKFPRALALAEDLIARLRSSNIRLLLPEALYLRGKVLLVLNRKAPAYEQYLEAQVCARTIGSRRTLWRILYELSKLEEDPKTAEQLRQEARQILGYILAQFRQEHQDLRVTFLEMADVRAMLEED